MILKSKLLPLVVFSLFDSTFGNGDFSATEQNASRGLVTLEQYTPDKADWSNMNDKSVLNNDAHTDHSPDGITWIAKASWIDWDGTIYDPTKYSKQELSELICPGNTIRGLRELFYATNPFADNMNPTKAEVDYWHTVAINHVRAMVNYTEPEYIIKPDKCLHIRALWSDERRFTRMWDTDEYPGTCEGSSNGHCGAGFIPNVDDQQEYLPDDIGSCWSRAGSEGVFSAAKSNIPWSAKWIRPFCSTLGSEGFWGGHTGPWFHRSEFGWSWWDTDPDNFNSNAVLRAKWSGPSGESKYVDPIITDGKLTVNIEGVNPEPRFPGFQCVGINWLFKTDSATACYEEVMANDSCGKRFMTFNVGNFGCACYPPDVATCAVEYIAMRATWDFEPIVSIFEGIFIDSSKALSFNNLPYKDRRCPGIIWLIGAGDLSQCLQIVIQDYSDQCGRNFITWMGNGGCACYPPDQLTCTKNESPNESGRQTYELELDPAYTTNSPTAAPIVSPTIILSSQPSSVLSFNPTTIPSIGSSTIPSFDPTIVPSALSSSPSYSPTFLSSASCKSNEKSLFIELQADKYSKFQNQISIYTKKKQDWKKMKQFKEFPNDKIFTYNTCLPKWTCNKLKITDSKNNGICCKNGQGWYNVYWEGIKLDHDTFDEDNGSKQILLFGECQTASPTSYPTKGPSIPPKSPCAANEKMLFIEFMTDWTSKWQNVIFIQKKSKRGWKKVQKLNKFPASELFTHQVCLKNWSCNRFKITDKKKDGLGKGWYNLYWAGEKLDHNPFTTGREQVVEFGNCSDYSNRFR